MKKRVCVVYVRPHQDQPTSGEFSWDQVPVYPGATLQGSEPCPVHWQGCETCEGRTYVVAADPESAATDIFNCGKHLT